MSEANSLENPDPRWKSLYTIAGVAAFVSILVILLGFITYFIWPYTPGQDSAENILLLLYEDPLGGLVSLDLFLFIGNLFSLALFLTLYISLRQVDEAIALLALAVGLIGLVLLVPARPILELVHLSQAYVVATEAEKPQIVSSAATLLALFDGIGWYMNTLLGGLSLLTSSILMLRSRLYSKATAYVGIATNLVLVGFVIPPISLLMLFLCLPGYITWYILLGQRFFQLGRVARKKD
jgi:hypothetical protein